MSDSASPEPAPEGRKMPARTPRDFRFWLVFLGIGVSTVITALELSAVATALPQIANALHASTFVWVGSAYTIAATAFIPLSGGLAQLFGRRAVILASLFIMAAGSAMCGAAPSMNFLIAARTIQGIGGGGIASTTAIIISDLVPLHERGIFNGLIGIFWAVSSGAGPIIGGALAQAGQWRWLFYLNIPICGFAAAIMVFFLQVRTPPGTFKEKFVRIDWFGSMLVIAATTSTCVALTWSGIEHAWTSVAVLVPLILGLVGLVAFLAYEGLYAKYPIVPFSLMSTMTGISGYLQTFIMPIAMLGIVYYVPVYFQACKDASPIRAGLDQLTCALVLAPTGIISGVTVKATRRYRPQLWLSWVFLLVGIGAYTTLHADTPSAHAIGFQVIIGMGIGILTTTTYFPVLAPLPVSSNGLALSYFMFLRNFAQVWGVTIGGSVLQNQLMQRIPPAFLAQFPEGTAIAYASIPLVRTLPEPLRAEVRAAFAESLRVVWLVLLGIAAVGALASAFMRHLPLHTYADDEWGLEQRERARDDAERSGGSAGAGATGFEDDEKVGPGAEVVPAGGS